MRASPLNPERLAISFTRVTQPCTQAWAGGYNGTPSGYDARAVDAWAMGKLSMHTHAQMHECVYARARVCVCAHVRVRSLWTCDRFVVLLVLVVQNVQR